MLVRFSQKWAKQKYEKLVREAVNFVKGSRSAPDLLVKVFFYKNPRCAPINPSSLWSGGYRSRWLHGLYPNEEKYANIDHVVTLKFVSQIAVDATVFEVGDCIPYEGELVSLRGVAPSDRQLGEAVVEGFSHEFKHYLDMRKLREKRKFRHWEVRARKFAEKQLEKWIRKQKIASFM